MCYNDGAMASPARLIDTHLHLGSEAFDADREEVLAQWRALSVHKPGDRIHCVLAERTVDGTWVGIDDQGRAVLTTAEGTVAVSAGDLFLA